MPVLVIGAFQAVEVDDDGRDGSKRFSLQTAQFFAVKSAIVELCQDIVFAEIFEIGFRLLAGSNVSECDLHPRPIAFVTGKTEKCSRM